MAVGVYAAQSSFTVTVANEVNLVVENVDGELYGKRYGDVLLGEVSMGDAGLSRLIDNGTITDASQMDGTIADFIYLYGKDDSKHAKDGGQGYREHAENMAKIEVPVNFYTQNKDTLSIYYVFKFEYEPSSVCNVNIELVNNSTIFTDGDTRASEVTQTYKYFFGATGTAEPADWTNSGTAFVFDENRSANIQCLNENTSTDVVYIFASLTVTRTDTLASAYTLGLSEEDEYHWAFGLNLTPV